MTAHVRYESAAKKDEAIIPNSIDLPKDVCDRMGLTNCRLQTVDPTVDPGTGVTVDEVGGNSAFSGPDMILVLIGSICGLCICAMIAYLVYLGYVAQQRQPEHQEERDSRRNSWSVSRSRSNPRSRSGSSEVVWV